MTPWLQCAGVLSLAVLGALVGHWFSRLPRGRWAIGYALAFVPTSLVIVAKRVQTLGFEPPFSWLVSGRAEFSVMACLAAMILSVLVPRLEHRRDRIAVRCGIIAFTVFMVLPFALPPLLEDTLAGLPTTVDADGVCLQSTGYTCGPAAAVTALYRLGFTDSEGELAVQSQTTPVSGTQADTLSEVLRRRYARDGLRAEYRSFESVAALYDRHTVITVINFSLLVDHYVTVLGGDTRTIRLGDPMTGLRVMSVDEFEHVWRKVGIALSRDR